VINYYIAMSILAHNGQICNAPPEFAHVSIGQGDIAAPVAFLESLTEDYDDS